MKWINAEQQVSVTIYDEEHEEHLVKTMTVEEMLDTYTNEGCPTIYPSVESKIVRCKDCVYYGWDCVDMPYGMTRMIRWCNKFYTVENENIEVEPTDFCKWAERKVDE